MMGLSRIGALGCLEVLKLRIEMFEGDFFAGAVLYVIELRVGVCVCVCSTEVQKPSFISFDDTAEPIYDAMAGQNASNVFHNRQQDFTVPVSSQS